MGRRCDQKVPQRRFTDDQKVYEKVLFIIDADQNNSETLPYTKKTGTLMWEPSFAVGGLVG